jgi:glutaredoxin 3
MNLTKIFRSSERLELASISVDKAVSENFIVVYSKNSCPYCVMAKDLLKSLNQDFLAIELDQQDDGRDIQNYLAKSTGHKTVPNIFINQKHIGGCASLQEMVNPSRSNSLYISHSASNWRIGADLEGQ